MNRPSFDELSGEALRTFAEDFLRDLLRTKLSAGADDLSVYAKFAELGLGSSAAVELIAQAGVALGVPLSPTLLFDHCTVSQLSEHLAEHYTDRLRAIAAGLSREAAPQLEPRIQASAALEDATPRPADHKPSDRSSAVAVIGLACRFPGAENADDFWANLCAARDSISEVPKERFDLDVWYDADPRKPSRTYCRWGGWLSDIKAFDADFFRISRHEAEAMAPQQRILLEVAWHALEHAGCAGERASACRTGVFVGVIPSEYAMSALVEQQPGRALHEVVIEPTMATGEAMSMVANRLSYVFGLTGPSLAIDTACSSSLVATHFACQSLLLGECDMALAAGVNVGITPGRYVAFSRAGMFSPDGRCKAFDAGANGYVCGEGVGVLVLKLLDRALAEGDRVLAVLRGSSVNQDGATNGLTAPNPAAQQRVIEDAHRRAGISADSVSYVEAHGTGTSLGDPIELRALTNVFGASTPRRAFCGLGSVKGNVGHLEGAAGIASLIKVVLSLRAHQIAPTLHFVRPNHHIDFVDSPFFVASRRVPWKSAGPRRAGVSSFGFGGTNAHIVVEEAPADLAGPSPSENLTHHLLTLSAASAEALEALGAAYAQALDRCSDSLADVCASAATGRAGLAHRTAVVATSCAEMRDKLVACNSVVRKVAPARRPRVAFLFTGQGSQYVGMAAELLRQDPCFRDDFEHCAATLGPYLDVSLERLVLEDTGLLSQTAYAQPATFAVEYSLARFWMRLVEPAVMVGHSLGEYVAACLAGVISLEDVLPLVARRGRLMQDAPGRGAMAAVMTSRDGVGSLLTEIPGLEIAAVNGPNSVVVTGTEEAVKTALSRAATDGLQATPLDVSHAFHSHLMEPVLGTFAEALASVRLAPPRLRLLSNRTAQPAGAELATPDYWLSHLREPVLFGPSIEWLLRDGVQALLEIGPGKTLCNLATQVVGMTADATGCDPLIVPSLTRGVNAWASILTAAGSLWTAGIPIVCTALAPHGASRRVDLPLYPFQRAQYWLKWQPFETTAARRAAAPIDARREALHALRTGCRSVSETLSFLVEQRRGADSQ